MSDSRWSALLFAAAVLVRVVAWMGSAIFGTDSGHYLLMADWIREGRWHEAMAVGYHPMFPLLIAVVRSASSSTEVAGNMVSILLGAAGVFPLYRMVLAAFQRPAAIFAVALYAFQPSIVEVQSEIMTESTFLFFLFSAQWLTWKMLEDPTPARGAVLGAAAAGAFLTRPEGILAIALALGWPLLLLFRRPGTRWRRAAGLAVTFAVIVLAVSPYLLWVKSYRGRWALSPRQSAMSVERELGMDSQSPQATEKSRGYFYLRFARSVFRLTSYGLWIPFAAIGLRSLSGFRSVYYLSLPLAHFAGILYTLRTHPFMSDRYVMGPVTLLLGGLAGCGMTVVLAGLARKRPDARWRPCVSGALVLAVAVLPTVRVFQLRRYECLSYPVAASRILEQGPKPRGMSGPVEQVAYLCGVRSFYSAETHEGIRQQLDLHQVDCYVYSEKDLRNRKAYVEMLQSCPALEPPVEVKGPPGTLTVYYQRAK